MQTASLNFSVREKNSGGMLLLISGALYLYVSPVPENSGGTWCLFHQVTGFACPACGTGRGIRSLLHGHFQQALYFNPLSYVAAAAGVIAFAWLLNDFLKNQFTLLPALKKPVPFKAWILPAILLGVNWYWNIVKGL